MGKNKVLVKVHPEGKYVVDIDKVGGQQKKRDGNEAGEALLRFSDMGDVDKNGGGEARGRGPQQQRSVKGRGQGLYRHGRGGREGTGRMMASGHGSH